MFKSIRTSLGLTFGFLILIGLFSVGTTLWTVTSQFADALVINLAGREQMLAQRTAKLALLGADSRPAMDAATHEWEEIFKTLRDGGEVVYEGRMVALPPTTDPLIRAQLDRVWSLWEPFHTAVHAILQNPAGNPAFVQGSADINVLSESILTEIDRAVQLYQAAASSRIAQVERIQLAFLIAGALAVTFSVGLINWQIIRPLDVLEARVRQVIDGDLVSPVPIVAQNEIGRVARSFDKMRRHLSEQLERIAALHEIDVAIMASLDLKQRLNVLLEKVTERLHVDAAAVAFTEPETHALRYAARRGLGNEFFQDGLLEMKESVVSRVAHSGEVAAIADVRSEPHFVRRAIAERLGIVSYLAVPLRGRRGIIGVLELTTRQPHVFSQEEIDFFVTLAGQAAIAIENAQLFEETQRRALEQSTVSEIARTLNATLDVRHAFPTIVRGLRTLTHCDRVSLALLDETHEYFTMTVLDEPRPELAQGTRLPLTATSAAADVLAGRPHLTTDLSAEADYPAEQALYQAGHRSRVNLPLVIGERVIGSLNLTSREVGMFIPAQLPVLQQIASAVAIAIENTRLFEAERTRREELAALYDLSRALVEAAYDFDAILNSIARRAVETVKVTFARIALIEDGECVVRAAYPMRDLNLDMGVGYRETTLALPTCYRVAQQNMPVVLHRDDPALGDQERQALFLGIAQTLCLVPLRANAQVLGLLMLGEARQEKREPFTSEKIRLARSIGDQAASALHRAELYAELERAYLQTVFALANAVDAKDTYTANHAQRLAQMALAVGRELGMNTHELEDLRYGAILHDIGKIGVPDAILKKPAKLDAAEWEEMRQHPIIGARILAPIPRLAGAARIVRHHHERYDGKGYPDGLAGEAIPLGARILTVVDSYSAIVDQRVYKAARSHDDAVAELKRNAGTQFDPKIVEIFLRLLEHGLDVTEETKPFLLSERWDS